MAGTMFHIKPESYNLGETSLHDQCPLKLTLTHLVNIDEVAEIFFGCKLCTDQTALYQGEETLIDHVRLCHNEFYRDSPAQTEGMSHSVKFEDGSEHVVLAATDEAAAIEGLLVNQQFPSEGATGVESKSVDEKQIDSTGLPMNVHIVLETQPLAEGDQGGQSATTAKAIRTPRGKPTKYDPEEETKFIVIQEKVSNVTAGKEIVSKTQDAVPEDSFTVIIVEGQPVILPSKDRIPRKMKNFNSAAYVIAPEEANDYQETFYVIGENQIEAKSNKKAAAPTKKANVEYSVVANVHVEEIVTTDQAGIVIAEYKPENKEVTAGVDNIPTSVNQYVESAQEQQQFEETSQEQTYEVEHIIVQDTKEHITIIKNNQEDVPKLQSTTVAQHSNDQSNEGEASQEQYETYQLAYEAAVIGAASQAEQSSHEAADSAVEEHEEDDAMEEIEVEGPVYFRCIKCRAQFESAKDLRAHMKTHAELKHQCSICDKTFFTVTGLKNHEATHTSVKSLACGTCAKLFRTTNELRMHMVSHTDYRPEVCKTCGKAFRSKSNLRDHMRIHTDSRPFKCRICSKAFRQRGQHTRHMRTHSDDRPYACHICPQAFKDKTDLNIHVLEHEGLNPLRCKNCGKTFAKKIYLVVHQRAEAGIKPYACRYCGKRFTHRSGMNTHERAHRNPESRVNKSRSMYDENPVENTTVEVSPSTSEPPPSSGRRVRQFASYAKASDFYRVSKRVADFNDPSVTYYHKDSD